MTDLVLHTLSSATLWALLSGGAAQAALPDPTRPPPGLSAASTGGVPVPRQAAATSLDLPTSAARQVPPAPAVPVTPPRVQAIHLLTGQPQGNSSALIDGRLVRPGDRVGDATVHEIRHDGVWLRLARGGTQWLGLYALVEPTAPDPQDTSANTTATAPRQSLQRKEP